MMYEVCLKNENYYCVFFKIYTRFDISFNGEGALNLFGMAYFNTYKHGT